MVVAAFLPVGVGEDLAALIDDASVAVHELPVSDLAQQDLDLVLVPAVVLVGECHVVGRDRRERKRPLEVPVETDPLRRARDHEARIVTQLVLNLGVALRGRAVVAHHAHPVAVRLGAERIELPAKQRDRRLVRGHANRHERALGGFRGVQLERRRRLDDLDSPERRRGFGAVLEARPQDQLELLPGRVRAYRDHAPEAAHEAPDRWVRRERLQHVPARHALRTRPDLLAVQDQRQLSDWRAARNAPAACEQRAAAPGRKRAREREVERGDETLVRTRGGLSDPGSQAAHPTQAPIRSMPC